MVSANSPVRVLRAQTDRMAAMLKAVERGDTVDGLFADKLVEARKRDSFTFAIAMDDRTIAVTLPWADIKVWSESKLSDFLLRQMRGARYSGGDDGQKQ